MWKQARVSHQTTLLPATVDSVYIRYWDQLFPLSSFQSWLSVCSINLNQFYDYRCNVWCIINVQLIGDLHTYSSHSQKPLCISWDGRCGRGGLIVFQVAVGSCGQSDQWQSVCATGHQSHKEPATVKVNPFPAFFLLPCYYSAGGCSTPLPLSFFFFPPRWELSSAAVWV